MSDTPPIKRLGLPTRDGKALHLVQVQQGQPPVLTTAQPQDASPEQRRLKATGSQGVTPSPRTPPLATVNIPLDTRTQTILSYEVDAETQAALNGQGGKPANRGRR